MKVLRVKDLIEYNRSSERKKENFINKLKEKREEEKKKESSGDYWVKSISALKKAFKKQNIDPIKNKIIDIEKKLEQLNIPKRTRLGNEANLEILYNYEDKDISEWLPQKDITILSQPKKGFIIQVNKILIKISPSYVYAYEKEGEKYIGGIWFIPLKGGFRKEELGAFSEAMYAYLLKNFGEKYKVSEENCRVVDVIKIEEVNYKMVKDGKPPSILISVIKDLKKRLK